MSDEIRFSCLACGQHIVCDASESGRPMLCPACDANLTVPHREFAPSGAEPETPESSDVLPPDSEPGTTGSSDLPPPDFETETLPLFDEPPPAPESETPVSSDSPSPTPRPQTPTSPVTPPSVPGAVAVASSRTSRLAIASLVCSLLSLITCVGWLPGIICGHLAKAGIRRDPTLKGRGLATAGLFISYATLIFGIGLAAAFVLWWSAIFKNAYQQAKLAMATNQIVSVPVQSQPETVSNNVEAALAASSGWTMDVKDAQIPESRLSGKIHGHTFKFRRGVVFAGNIKFISANGAESVLLLGLGTNLANNTFEVDPHSATPPKIEISWHENGQNQTQSFDAGYAMELKFDVAHGRRFPGRIYLCFPDDAKSYLAGVFTATPPRAKPAQPATQ